jgi:Domain of unknown function (DUF4157)
VSRSRIKSSSPRQERERRSGIPRPPSRRPVATESMLTLQSNVGNSAFSRALESRGEVSPQTPDQGKSSLSQTAIKLSNPDDVSEREADRFATAATGQIPTTANSANSNSSPLASHLNDATAALAGGGKVLPNHLRDLFEPTPGKDLGEVRLHTDGRVAEAADGINARAYTVGKDIAFGAGEYAPETTRGWGLLAHELAHALQPAKSGPTTVHRKTKGEAMVDKANVFLSQDANLKAEVDVLKAAIREMKKGKSVAFNKKEGLKRVRNAAGLLKLDAKKTAVLSTDWEWLADNAGKAGQKDYTAKEKAFFRVLRSSIDVLDDKYPQQQTKFWLKNTAPQIVDIIINVANADMPADQLFAYANKEGLIDYVRGEIPGLGSTATPTSAQLAGVSTTKSISGFDRFGLDDFRDELTAKREPLTGFLPAGFDLKKTTPEDRVNEKGRTVHSAIFPDLTMALQALAAMLKRRRKIFLAEAKANGYATPTTDELVYWTYVYFNSGEFNGQLAKHKGKRVLSDWIKKKEFPNSIKLLQSYQLLKDMKLF